VSASSSKQQQMLPASALPHTPRAERTASSKANASRLHNPLDLSVTLLSCAAARCRVLCAAAASCLCSAPACC
jgi:hypothetical protein